MAWQRAKITIPKRFGPLERQAIAQEVIDYIIKRTKDGKNIKGGSFPGYSKAYKSSLDFKIAGKGNTVDLTLTGELLDSIELLSHKSGEIVVGYQKGDAALNGKAEGNQLGTYGTSKPSKAKARPYLGIMTGDLREILKRYPNDRDESLTRAEEELAAAAEAGTIVDGIEFDPGADDGE